jgi:hypothetical protein
LRAADQRGGPVQEGRGLGVQSGGVADEPGFERLGAQQAAGDARDDQGDVTGAERGGLIRSVAASCLP